MKVTRVCAIFYFTLCLFSVALHADDYVIVWADTIDSGDWDGASSIEVDNANNIIVTGSCSISGDNDYFVVKYDSGETILW
jgi:hypothetical protein